MSTVLGLLAVLVVLFVAASLATREGDVLADAPPDAADLALPAGPLQPEDVAEVRFGLALRGYRMSEVDAALARLADELTRRDARIGELEKALVDVVEPALAELEQQHAAAAPSPEVATELEEEAAAEEAYGAAAHEAAHHAAAVEAAEAARFSGHPHTGPAAWAVTASAPSEPEVVEPFGSEQLPVEPTPEEPAPVEPAGADLVPEDAASSTPAAPDDLGFPEGFPEVPAPEQAAYDVPEAQPAEGDVTDWRAAGAAPEPEPAPAAPAPDEGPGSRVEPEDVGPGGTVPGGDRAPGAAEGPAFPPYPPSSGGEDARG